MLKNFLKLTCLNSLSLMRNVESALQVVMSREEMQPQALNKYLGENKKGRNRKEEGKKGER
jgi:hypothetical protein